MNAWPPQASYPCGNFSDTSRAKLSLVTSKGSIGHAFAVRIRTGNRDQASFCPFALREVSVLAELALGHLRYNLTDVPPQSNSPPDCVLGADRARLRSTADAAEFPNTKPPYSPKRDGVVGATVALNNGERLKKSPFERRSSPFIRPPSPQFVGMDGRNHSLLRTRKERHLRRRLAKQTSFKGTGALIRQKIEPNLKHRTKRVVGHIRLTE